MSKGLYIVAGVLLLALIGAIAWLTTRGPSDSPTARFSRPVTASNPGLEARFTYDAAAFELTPYESGLDYPLQLDGDGWSFYGKRIGGMGAVLRPGPQVYDFVTNNHDAVYLDWYGLERGTDPIYEDVEIAGHPALHTVNHYVKPADARGWPEFFPEAVKTGDQAHVEGWVFLTEKDLYFFSAVSPRPLTEEQQMLARGTIESMQFGLLGGQQRETAQPEAAPPPESAPPETPPAADSNS